VKIEQPTTLVETARGRASWLSTREIVRRAESREWLVSWLDSRGMIAWDWTEPGKAITLLSAPLPTGIQDWSMFFWDAHEQMVREFQARFPGESAPSAMLVHGVAGLAATDPEWDGKPTFVCANPACGAVHDVHENVAMVLWERKANYPKEAN
jgi:hypothetical protein